MTARTFKAAADFQANFSEHHFPHANPICTLQNHEGHKTTIQVLSFIQNFRSLVVITIEFLQKYYANF